MLVGPSAMRIERSMRRLTADGYQAPPLPLAGEGGPPTSVGGRERAERIQERLRGSVKSNEIAARPDRTASLSSRMARQRQSGIHKHGTRPPRGEPGRSVSQVPSLWIPVSACGRTGMTPQQLSEEIRSLSPRSPNLVYPPRYRSSPRVRVATGASWGEWAAPPNGSGSPGSGTPRRGRPCAGSERPCTLPLWTAMARPVRSRAWAGRKSDESGETNAARGAFASATQTELEVLSKAPCTPR